MQLLWVPLVFFPPNFKLLGLVETKLTVSILRIIVCLHQTLVLLVIDLTNALLQGRHAALLQGQVLILQLKPLLP